MKKTWKIGTLAIAIGIALIFTFTACLDDEIGRAPDTPSGLTAYATSSSRIDLSWNSVSNATGYRVYRGLSAYGSYDLIGEAYTNSGYAYNLSSGTTYYFKVSAYNSFGESGQSYYDSATTYSSSSGGGTGTGGTEYSPSHLSSGVWRTSYLSSSSSEEWFSFYAYSGQTYYVWWDDKYSGSGSHTADIYVRAYYDNSSSYIFSEDSAYTSPRSFTANRSGYVLLNVYTTSSSTSRIGTYRIVYSTSSYRP